MARNLLLDPNNWDYSESGSSELPPASNYYEDEGDGAYYLFANAAGYGDYSRLQARGSRYSDDYLSGEFVAIALGDTGQVPNLYIADEPGGPPVLVVEGELGVRVPFNLSMPYISYIGTSVEDASLPYSGEAAIYLPATVTPPKGNLVYELDRGWSFDGAYIPHFVELNWYFGENPFDNHTVQKVRIHGLAKGLTQLSMAVASMQTEYDSDYTEPQYVDLPRNQTYVSSEFVPTTNYVDSSNSGIALQMKFEGRNLDISKPEPAHVLQVLAIQTSPQGNGNRVN